MTFYRGCLIALFLLLYPSASRAQDPHVFSEYKKQLNATIVYTDKMHVLKTPEQAVEVEFNFRLKEKKSKKQPERVDLTLWSYSRELKFQKDKAKDTIISVDGQPMKIDQVVYSPLQGATTDFERIKGAYVELIVLYLSPEEAKKFATAKNVKLNIANLDLGFTDNQMNTIRDFAGRITTQ